MKRRQTPVDISIPPWGVLAAESMHGRGFSMPRDRHTFHELYFVYRGALKYFEGQATDSVYLTQGSLFPIERDRIHRIEDVSEVTLLILALSDSFLTSKPYQGDLWKELLSRRPMALRPDDYLRAKIENSFRTILAEQASDRLGAETIIQAEAMQLLVTLARLPADCSESNSYTRVASIVRALDESYYEEWSVDEAARRAHLSRRRFTMIFRELTGMGLLEYRNDRRLEQAANLIGGHGSTIAGAAFSSGFQDLAHFYRLFKRKFGKPPGEWATEGED